MRNVYVVVLAGGSGERLWPLSSPARPKQLIPFIQGASLLEQTLARVFNVVTDPSHIIVLTNNEQRRAIEAVVNNRATVMCEPIGRNTGPAIALTALLLRERDPDAVVVVLPSDHFIPDTTAFVTAITTAIEQAQQSDHLILLGVRPTYPATGYGYIQYMPKATIGASCFTVARFHEKPEKEQAINYMAMPTMLWNIGMFVGKAALFVTEFERWAPELFYALQAYRAGRLAYATIPSISIDHAVMEKSLAIAVLPVTFPWYDVGNLVTFLTLKAQHDPLSLSPTINVAGENNLALTNKKTIAFVGLSDVCVVETEDVLMVVAREHAEAVRQVVNTIKQKEQGREAISNMAERQVE